MATHRLAQSQVVRHFHADFACQERDNEKDTGSEDARCFICRPLEEDRTSMGDFQGGVMKMFHLERTGEGRVAEGVEFTDGRVVLRWLAGIQPIEFYETIHDLRAVREASGRSLVVITEEQQKFAYLKVDPIAGGHEMSWLEGYDWCGDKESHPRHEWRGFNGVDYNTVIMTCKGIEPTEEG